MLLTPLEYVVFPLFSAAVDVDCIVPPVIVVVTLVNVMSEDYP